VDSLVLYPLELDVARAINQSIKDFKNDHPRRPFIKEMQETISAKADTAL
jgi:hypothetical protein